MEYDERLLPTVDSEKTFINGLCSYSFPGGDKGRLSALKGYRKALVAWDSADGGLGLEDIIELRDYVDELIMKEDGVW